MPELPEVETIKLFLAQNITGLKINSVQVLNPKSFIGNSAEIVDKEIKRILRRGKVLQIDMGDLSLLTHLKMSGQLIFKRKEIDDSKKDFIGGHPTKDMFGDLPNKSTRIIFNLSDGSKIFFNDQRKFGWIKLANREQVVGNALLSTMGPEPLEKEFTVEVLKKNLLKRKKTAVKVALLDQTIVAGVGNIYACEACFLAGIDPRKLISNLRDVDFEKLHHGVVESLKNGIKHGGSSKTHFINPEGKKGVFLDFAYVYARENLPCKNCQTPIMKIKLGGRGTYFCPKCQVD